MDLWEREYKLSNPVKILPPPNIPITNSMGGVSKIWHEWFRKFSAESVGGQLTTFGYVVRNSNDLFVTRAIQAGSSKISITNGTGDLGNTLVDVTESALTLNNIGGVLGATKGGTGVSSIVTGDILYGSDTNTIAVLPGNISTTRKFLRQTGDGVLSAAPVWDTVTKTDLGLTNVEDTALSTWAGSTNITTLGTVTTGTWSATSIAVGKGGTGQTSYTDGQLLIGNTTGNTLTKSTLTAGAGITITNGSGSITIAGGPEWNKISTATASSSANIDFTLSTSYRAFKIIFSNIIPATDGASLVLRTSTDGGSTFSSGASDYVIDRAYITGGTTSTVTASQSYFLAAPAIGNSTNEQAGGEILIINPQSASYCRMLVRGQGNLDTGFPIYFYGGGARGSAGDVDAVRLLMSTGNISSGTLTLYGMLA